MKDKTCKIQQYTIYYMQLMICMIQYANWIFKMWYSGHNMQDASWKLQSEWYDMQHTYVLRPSISMPCRTEDWGNL